MIATPRRAIDAEAVRNAAGVAAVVEAEDYLLPGIVDRRANKPLEVRVVKRYRMRQTGWH
jgi:hypothetical protein